jgi:hypothetical protein
MQSLGTLKQGDTFTFYANLTNRNGAPLTGAASKLRSQIRTFDDIKLSELAISEWVDPDAGQEGHVTITGRYLLRDTVGTQSWPVGTHFIDVQYTDSGTVSSSETFSLNVEGDITHGA